MSKIELYKPENALQTRPYDPNTFNKRDGEEIKKSVNDLYDLIQADQNSLLGFEQLNSTNWNAGIGSNKRTYPLTDPNTAISLTGTVDGGAYILTVTQAGNLNNKLQINGLSIPVAATGDTVIGILNVKGKNLFFSEAALSIDVPEIISQSPMYITAIEGEDFQLYMEVNSFELIESISLEKNGKPVLDASGTEYQDKANVDTAKAYGFEITLIDGRKLRSKPMFVSLGEASPPEYKSGANDFDVDAGEPFSRTLIFSGTPTPDISYVKVVNGANVPYQNGATLTDAITYSTKYKAIATNRYKVKVVDVPAEYEEDGTTIKTPATYKDVYQIFTAESPVFTVTPIKLPQIAPTNPVIDDANNKFGFTKVPGITADNAYEKTVSAGDIFAVLDKNPFDVPDADLAAGVVGARVAETDTHNASPWLFNTQPYNTSIIYTLFNAQANSTLVTANKKTTSKITSDNPPNWPGFDTVPNKTIKAGQTAKLKFDKDDVLDFGAAGWGIPGQFDGDPNTNKVFIGKVGGQYILSYFNSQGQASQIGIGLNDATPTLEVVRNGSDGKINVNRYNTDGTLFNVPIDTSDVPALNGEYEVNVSVARFANSGINNLWYFGVTTK